MGRHRPLWMICILCLTVTDTALTSSEETSTGHSGLLTDQTDVESDEEKDSASGHSDFLSSEIKSLLGTTADFSYLVPFTDGVQLTLNKKPMDFRAFTVDMTNAKLLDSMLRGRNISELLYVAAKLTGIEAKASAIENSPLTTLAMEVIFDPADDTVMARDDVDELEREITEHPSILDLDHKSESSVHDRIKRKATKHSFTRWPSTTIPYRISSDFDNDTVYTKAIRDGIQHWEEETCLTFNELPADKIQVNYILFKNGNGCYSRIGKVFNSHQIISIGKNGNCGTKGVVAHEIGHAIGFYHEHQRPDRDSYIRINTGNIVAGERKNFFKKGWHEAITAGIPYDYSSVMHYGLKYFASNNRDTISVLEDDMNKNVGSQKHLSFYDVKLANYMYCSDKCVQGLAWSSCQNDGYRDPKDCSRCKCPDGWTGRYCTEVKPGVNVDCGLADLTATLSWQTLKSPNYDTSSYPKSSECTWRIQAPKTNQRIVLRFGTTVAITPCTIPCTDYLEVRYKDMARTGPRYCCYTRPSRQIVSHGNQILLLQRTWSTNTNKAFALEYRVESCGCPDDTSVSSIPACVETQSYQCTYQDCSSGQCVIKLRNNTCYKEIPTCCNGFRLQGNTCYRTSSPSSPWSSWSGWSACTKTCGSGSQSRTRSCLTPPCSGNWFESKTCNSDPCPEMWSNWSPWSVCSVTCGSGTQRKRRSCLTPPCSGTFMESQSCNTGPCPATWSSWSPWSTCTRSCGSGSQIKTRSCLTSTCSGSSYEYQICNREPCPARLSSWSAWSACSKTCGSGSKSRSRSCLTPPCSEPLSKTQICNTNPCPAVWSNWSPWSVCSVTCGSGTQRKRRSCPTPPCSGTSIESQSCNTEPCPATWSSWSPWSPCTRSCGSGSQIKTRSCLTSTCSGSWYEYQICNREQCPARLSSWSAWSACSKTCGTGSKSRSRSCLTPPCSEPVSETQICNTNVCPAMWSSWSPWSVCSRTCGSGYQYRLRSCPGKSCSGQPIHVQLCNKITCTGSWSNWYSWTSCSRTCGSGVRTRSRRCNQSQCSGSTTQTETCNRNSCPNQWSNWDEWSSCSKTCSFGFQVRRRNCQSSPCSGSTTDSKFCYITPCPALWSDWSGCSKTCGSGTRTRTRICRTPPCSGYGTENESCNTKACPEVNEGTWSVWIPWTSCSRSCGFGFQFRSRTCLKNPCSGYSFEGKTCNTRKC